MIEQDPPVFKLDDRIELLKDHPWGYHKGERGTVKENGMYTPWLEMDRHIEGGDNPSMPTTIKSGHGITNYQKDMTFSKEGLQEMNLVICSEAMRRAIRARAKELGLWANELERGPSKNCAGLWCVGGTFYHGPGRGLVTWCDINKDKLALTPEEFLARMEKTAELKHTK